MEPTVVGRKFSKKEEKLNRPQENVYTIGKDADCILCKDMPCCPEHCCDWDSCECTTCKPCGLRRQSNIKAGETGSAFRRVMDPKTCEEHYVETNDPVLLIKNNNEEEAEYLNQTVIKVCMTKQEIKEQQARDALEATLESIPQEVAKVEEEILVHNFEVRKKVKKEIGYASGVRGIRALRIQRDILQDSETLDREIMTATRDRFFQAEQRAAAKKTKAHVDAQESAESSDEEKENIDQAEPERKSAAEMFGFDKEVPIPKAEAEPEQPKRLPRMKLKGLKKPVVAEQQKQNEVDNEEENLINTN